MRILRNGLKGNSRLRRSLVWLLVLCMSLLIFAGCGRQAAPEDGAQGQQVEQAAQATDEADADNVLQNEDASGTDADNNQGFGNDSTAAADDIRESGDDSTAAADALDPDGTYTSKEDVALYLHTYGELPSNFMTKKEAKELGWSGGSLEDYAPGMCIGGDRFGNYEGNLPDGSYHECDIDTLGASGRGAKRIVWSDDGRIYYTKDHYETFEQLY